MEKPINSLRHPQKTEDFLNPDRLLLFEKLVEDAINSQIFPGLEVLFFKSNQIFFHKAFGYKRLKPHKEKLELNSIFDIASMTKPVITATLIMILLEQGKLNLNEKITLYLPEFNENNKKNINIKHLLTHTSGLPAWANLYENMNSVEESINKLLNLSLEYIPGSKIVYSCMGYILLRLIIEKLTEEPIDQLAQKYILNPLGMTNSYFNPPKNLLDKIPATGECFWRNRIIHGEVHDENCFFLGGTAGNSGLFSTAIDIAIYSNMILNSGRWNKKQILSPNTINLMIKDQTEDFLPRGLGFQLKDYDHKPCGELFGQRSFGHLGFTGTSFWLDPDSKIGIILLTNRVHISYRGNIEAMKSFRMKAHNILISSLVS